MRGQLSVNHDVEKLLLEQVYLRIIKGLSVTLIMGFYHKQEECKAHLVLKDTVLYTAVVTRISEPLSLLMVTERSEWSACEPNMVLLSWAIRRELDSDAPRYRRYWQPIYWRWHHKWRQVKPGLRCFLLHHAGSCLVQWRGWPLRSAESGSILALFCTGVCDLDDIISLNLIFPHQQNVEYHSPCRIVET